MPWWSWILIWGALVLALIGVLAWLSFRLFTKAGSALVALGDLAEKASALEAVVDEVADRFEPAALADATALRPASRVASAGAVGVPVERSWGSATISPRLKAFAQPRLLNGSLRGS